MDLMKEEIQNKRGEGNGNKSLLLSRKHSPKLLTLAEDPTVSSPWDTEPNLLLFRITMRQGAGKAKVHDGPTRHF